MKVLIRCGSCGDTYWVKGDSQRPNEYGAHEDADLSECCAHIFEGGDFTPIDCDVEEP